MALNNSLFWLPLQGAREALDLGITGPEGIEISRPEEVRTTVLEEGATHLPHPFSSSLRLVRA